MSDLDRTLEAERRIINAATAGPWRADHSRDYESDVYAVFHNGDTPDQDLITTIPKPFMRDVGPDAEFIAHARTALPLRSAQVEAVLSIHRPVEVEPSATICSGCSTRRGTFPDFRYFPVVEYPCETVRAIEEAGA